MRDLEIKSLGATQQLQPTHGTASVQRPVASRFNMSEVLKVRFPKFSFLRKPQTEISDLDLPDSMKHVLANVDMKQRHIPAGMPFVNELQENLVVTEEDYIPDSSFKDRTYTEA